ncbi:hypothetical protein MTP99_016466 [Tenebrio molitor]|nr:hypothetical protein MTP99_016466 [Tenebrio molitor]
MITCSYNNDDGDEVVPGLDKVDEAKKKRNLLGSPEPPASEGFLPNRRGSRRRPPHDVCGRFSGGGGGVGKTRSPFELRIDLEDYNIKKKEEVVDPVQEEPNPLMRKKKTPEELAREAEAEDEDEFTKLKNTIETQVNELKSQIESKCVMQ